MPIVKRKPRLSKGRLTQQGDKFKTYEKCWGHAVFLCECGNRLILNVNDVERGMHQSCGCIRKEKTAISRLSKAVADIELSQYSIAKIKELIEWSIELPKLEVSRNLSNH